MPGTSRPLRLPECYLPSDWELVALVRRYPGLSLRHLCRLIWPALPWATTAERADSAAGRVREWPVALRAGAVGNRSHRSTAAVWLRDRMEELIQAGLVCYGRRRRDEVDTLAGLTYLPRFSVEDAAHLGPESVP